MLPLSDLQGYVDISLYRYLHFEDWILALVNLLLFVLLGFLFSMLRITSVWAEGT
jgi:hypothetical protein